MSQDIFNEIFEQRDSRTVKLDIEEKYISKVRIIKDIEMFDEEGSN